MKNAQLVKTMEPGEEILLLARSHTHVASIMRTATRDARAIGSEVETKLVFVVVPEAGKDEARRAVLIRRK